MKYFAGLDWGSSSHAVCVVDQAGRIVVRTEVRHDATGLAALQRELRRLAPIGEIPIAIERSPSEEGIWGGESKGVLAVDESRAWT
jgi:hypothetical protein